MREEETEKKDDEDKKIFVYHRGHINAGYTLNGERERERER